MDFIRPTSGSATIAGLDTQKDAPEVKKKIGYLSPNIPLYDHWNGYEHIDFVADLRNTSRKTVRRLIERLEYDPSKRVKSLSSGNKQKLGVILALTGNPEVLILDEPTSALDPLLQNTVYDILSEKSKDGATVFFSSHNLPEVERVCSRVGIIRSGKLVAVEDITDLRKKQLHSVRVDFAKPTSASFFHHDASKIVQTSDRSLTFHIGNNLQNFLKELSKHDVVDLEITRASLEEVFLSHYHKL